MSGELQLVDDDVERCAYCGRPAAGPCGSCRKMVCGDCCVLTDGGVETWAICLRCDRKGGRSLKSAWGGLLVWLALLIVALAALALLAILIQR
jgi:hypothetical protein